MASSESVSSLFEEACCVCMDTDKSEPPERFCACLYHYECLRDVVAINRKTSCAICHQRFRRCRIRKRRRPFTEFLFRTEICVTLVIGVLVMLYCIYFFLIAFYTYDMSRTGCSYTVQLWIWIPGAIFISLGAILVVICCILVKKQYNFWSEHNYTLIMDA